MSKKSGKSERIEMLERETAKLNREIKRLSSEQTKLLGMIEKLTKAKTPKATKPSKAPAKKMQRAEASERKGVPPVMPLIEAKEPIARPQKLAS